MAGITLEIAQTHLDLALAAHRRVSTAQEVSVDGDTNQQAQLEAILKDIRYWNNLVVELTPAASGGGIRVREIIPR
jgi:hypothetical protein